ncbi:MAG: PPOX class F420-dependent oxidoreductase [Thermoproteota archaeon]|jgi:PPOX class probable F420-dependent enzyme|nr:PPOX class F420-dependent oxidoreductase [Thermoproteota archaeon]
MNSKLQQFTDQKYLNLETYRKDQTPVQTPVWFVIENDQIYITTKETTGKVKRLRNNQNGRIAVCSMKGDIKGNWINVGLERINEDSDVEKIVKLRKKKYGFSARLISMFTSQKGKTVAYSIEFLDS